jgi:DNA polymerase
MFTKALEKIYENYGNEPALQDLIKEYGMRKPSLVHGTGNVPPRGVIVGEAPGAQEDALGSPFVGISGQFLRRHLNEAGIDPWTLWITNAVKYRPRKNRTPDHDEIMCSRNYLMTELGLVTRDSGKPIAVLAYGKTAAKAIFGQAVPIARKAGEVITDEEHPDAPRVMICWHPSAALRDAEARADFPRIIKSFAELLKGF